VYPPKYQSATNYYRSYSNQHTASALNYVAPTTAYQAVLPDMEYGMIRTQSHNLYNDLQSFNWLPHTLHQRDRTRVATKTFA